MSPTESHQASPAVARVVTGPTSTPPGWRRDAGTPTAALLTTVLWMALLTVGVLGFGVAPALPPAAAPVVPPLRVELLEVDLVDDSVALPVADPPEVNAVEPPPLLEPVSLPAPPTVAAVEVAAPEALVAFALPVAGPVRIVEAAQASYTRPVEAAVNQPATAQADAVQTLVYGRGEGRQPKPEYPRQAQRERQEGTVTVRFTVGANGRVLEAGLSSASPWPLLNESALRVIRERWRFQAGEPRAYEVAIRFVL